MKRNSLKTALIASSLLVISGVSQADWSLDNEQSQLNFVSVKKSAVAEIHTFKSVSGTLSDSGQVNVNIDLSSVDTKIPIRDERLLKVLSEAGAFPTAELTGQVDTAAVKALKAGESLTQDISMTLNLHGQTNTVAATVKVTALTNGNLQVATLQPVIINAADFALVAGVNELKKLAGLPSISAAVPVTAEFVFDAK
ncbi:YceI family protein [Aestuariicella hydrocarbonica]|uniref:YceI family protein n=1 Tax=Pseudomaricurvus hydrocarbonicus TaxID=1470433 RepID=A0A9E5MKB2_9GAMM|nr:YceI family protein [Aestuariicella hydrocarbonica]NHO65152.1 YceI family protein [Aestuariicella hydrocarbonica]